MAREGAVGEASREAAPRAAFVDRATELGLEFTHENGMGGEFLYPEMMGSGAAVLDYDGDGDLDLYLVQGGSLKSDPSEPRPVDRLYRNDLASADGAWRFVDVGERLGVSAAGYGMGVATADYDGDGWTDLYVTNLGPNQLLRNRGDGSFEDRTEASGVGDAGWGVPAVFFDFDADGRPDLYVGNYVDYAAAADVACYDTTGARDYCGPTAYPGAHDRLFRNLGGGRFEDVSRSSGVGRPKGRTLGAIAGDLDGDGRLDLYVANDGEPNFLWLNRGEVFEEGALLAGCAVDRQGRAQASMGLALGDADGDGRQDLLATHLTGEFNTFYSNAGDGRFDDRSLASGLGPPSLPLTGFGVAWTDFDGDGRLDLLATNGAVKSLEAQRRVGDPYPLRQPKQLFRNLGEGRFEEIGDAGEALTRELVGRGLAIGDLDGDGDEDALASHNHAPAALLINPRQPDDAWLGVVGVPPGTRIVVEQADTRKLAVSRTDGSYASTRDPRTLVSLAEGGRVELRLEGPRGRLAVRDLPAGNYVVFGR